MFSREFRFPSSVTFTHGMSVKHPLFLLKIVPNSLSHNRYGFVISKRVDKSAVERNRLRRQFSSLLEVMELKQGYDILFIISVQAKDKDRDVIQSALIESLQKGNLL